MIRVNISIPNPFKGSQFKNIWNKVISVNENKTFEVQIYRYGHNLFELNLCTNFWGSDHAGPSFELGILSLYASISLPDNRHWNYTTNSWQKYIIN